MFKYSLLLIFFLLFHFLCMFIFLTVVLINKRRAIAVVIVTNWNYFIHHFSTKLPLWNKINWKSRPIVYEALVCDDDDGDEYGRLWKFTAYKMHLPLHFSYPNLFLTSAERIYIPKWIYYSFFHIDFIFFLFCCSAILLWRSTTKKRTFLAKIISFEFNFEYTYVHVCECVHRNVSSKSNRTTNHTDTHHLR